MTVDTPPGYEPLFRSSPFTDLLGPIYSRKDAEGFTLGVRVAEKHCNARGLAHGGLLVTLADIALGYRMAFSQEPPISLTTANLSADFSGAAKLGDWIEVAVDIQHVGSRVAFANAYLRAGGKRIARISGVFANNGQRLEKS